MKKLFVTCFTIIILFQNAVAQAPIISVNPDSLYIELLQGEIHTSLLKIRNLGGSNLQFDIMPGSSTSNHSIQINGIDDYVEVVNSVSLNPTEEITLEAWIYQNINMFGWGWTAVRKADFQYYIEPGDAGTNYWTFGVNNGYISRVYTSIPVSVRNWHHIAGTYDGSTLRIYVDGQLSNSASTSGNIFQETGPLVIGKWEDDIFVGMVDEIRIWGIAKADSEIKYNMYRELSGDENELMAYWQCNESVGDTMFDRTIYANNGLLIGGVNWSTNAPPILPLWLSVPLDSANCLPDSSVVIEVMFNAAEIDSGDFYSNLLINSNDPVQPLINIPIHMLVSTTLDVRNEKLLPIDFNLYQNYPNPFNPNTKIKYSIPQTSNVLFMVFDILGNEIETLINEEKPAGNYEVEFDATYLPSGVYFYRLQALDPESSSEQGFVETKKMVLMK